MPHGTHANGLTQVGRTGRRTIDARAREDSRWIHQRVSDGDPSVNVAQTTDEIRAADERLASHSDQDVGRIRRCDGEAHVRSNHHAATGRRPGPVTARRNRPHNGQRRCRGTRKRCRPEPPRTGRSGKYRGRGVTNRGKSRVENGRAMSTPHARPNHYHQPHHHQRHGNGGNIHRMAPKSRTLPRHDAHHNSQRATMQASAPSPKRRGVRDRQPVGTERSRFA
ncbi:hypothetical protein V7x_38010 [Crateriforma conspicua]|uniref:Uncharacterized protein n=1 Tax=Crateriforma conspicua TaxID=2527996 RepID=A0A5C6FLR7_9PLAN|nr:hypothetical protein V7x_38010 [Crateriforma conspicua]